MGFNFRKSFKIAPGIRVNVTKKGISSISLKGKGVSANLGKKGTRTTVGIPGTGLSHSSYSPYKSRTNTKQAAVDPVVEYIVCAFFLGIILALITIWVI